MQLQPSQFKVNQAWILFQLSRNPITTERDGPAICFGLMDAASCFMLSGTFFPGTDGNALSKNNVQELLRKGWEYKKEYPEKLLVVKELLTAEIEAQTRTQGIDVTGVSESELKSVIGEAQQEFRKRFG
jgi:hypothetical protein